MKKGFNPHIKVTSWVAIVIILSIGSTFTYLIWANANESWLYETAYPSINKKISRAIINIETAGWKTYNDQGYGFSVSHPSKYSKTVSEIAPSSAINTPGTTVGPIVFVNANTPALKAAADAKFNKYWNYMEKSESPNAYCRKQVMESEQGYDIKIVFCLIANKEERYALIETNDRAIFVDGYTGGSSKIIKDTYGTPTKAISQGEFTQILSTFKFI
jgi:hypothetical protein